MAPKDSHTVWSSDSGDLRKKNLTPSPSPKGSPTGVLRKGESLPPQQQTAYLHRDSKGRGGKGVTLIKNLVLSEEEMSALARKIKQACGLGGTVKVGVIEIQGNNRERIAEVLVKLGYKVKMAGG
jgi:translation initiation factor 1